MPEFFYLQGISTIKKISIIELPFTIDHSSHEQVQYHKSCKYHRCDAVSGKKCHVDLSEVMGFYQQVLVDQKTNKKENPSPVIYTKMTCPSGICNTGSSQQV